MSVANPSTSTRRAGFHPSTQPTVLEFAIGQNLEMNHDYCGIARTGRGTTPPEELAKFRRWFAQFDADAWDAQIEADAAAGKLDALAEEALAEYRSGQAR